MSLFGRGHRSGIVGDGDDFIIHVTVEGESPTTHEAEKERRIAKPPIDQVCHARFILSVYAFFVMARDSAGDHRCRFRTFVPRTLLAITL